MHPAAIHTFDVIALANPLLTADSQFTKKKTSKPL